MTILGTVALIVLVILGVMVLRTKSDPMENESIRKALAADRTSGVAVSDPEHDSAGTPSDSSEQRP
jgi:hypothetical protein